MSIPPKHQSWRRIDPDFYDDPERLDPHEIRSRADAERQRRQHERDDELFEDMLAAVVIIIAALLIAAPMFLAAWWVQ